MNLANSLPILLVSRMFNAIGYFSLVFLLAVLLLEPPFLYNGTQISLLVGCLALTDRGMSLFWAAFIRQLGYKKSLLLGTCLPFFGLVGLIAFQNFVWCFVMLFLIGTGLSLESLASRLWISSIADRERQLKAFSRLHRVINVGAFVASGALVLFSYFKSVFFFIGGSAFFFALSIFVLFFYFREEENRVVVTENNIRIFSFFQNIAERKIIWIYFLALFLGVYFMCQMNLLPFYFKKLGEIPTFLGWMFALNPLLIIFFQEKSSRLFSFLQGKKNGLGILMGFLLMGIAFFTIVAFESVHRFWLTMVFMSAGEMFIIPHMDYLIGLQLPSSLRPALFAFSSILFAAGRALSEGIGIVGVDWFYRKHLAQGWWFVDSMVLMMVIVCGLFAMVRATDFWIKKSALETKTI